MKRGTVNKTVLLVIVFLISTVFVVMINQFLMPLFMAGLFSAMVSPAHHWLSQKLGGRENIASVLTVFGIVFLVLGPLSVLIGVVVAQAIHGLGEYRKRPFVRMNCAAVPESLADSELFGHEKGAFTGAINRRAGRFELAGNGTLLLDEISEMPLGLQAKLLRVIQEREFERVGGSRTLRAECRIIATTNRDLQSYVREGGFRQDLYYRLNVVPIHVPPLRERPEDIPMLADNFLKRHLRNLTGKTDGLRFRQDTLDILYRYMWPGNVRELEHLIERLCVMEKGPELTPAMLPPEVHGSICTPVDSATQEPARQSDPHSPPAEGKAASECPPDSTVPSPANTTLCLDELERHAILRAMEKTDGQRNQAADLLGVSIRTLRNKLNRYREEGSLPAGL